MRRIIAMEAASIDTGAIEGVLSLEEEQVMIDEAAQDAAEVDKDLGEAERVVEVSDALEDLAVIGDGIEEATPAEVALVETAGQMAVAGTDIEPEEIVPSFSGSPEVKDSEGKVVTPATESYVGKKIATEGLRETARTIWENIQKFVKEIWEKIDSFFYNLFGVIPNLRKKVKELEEEVAKAEKDKLVVADGAEIKLFGGVNSISMDYKVCDSDSEFKKGIESLLTASDAVYGKYAESVIKRGQIIKKAMQEFKPEDAEKVAAELHEGLVANRASFGNGTQILGNKVLQVIEGRSNEQGGGTTLAYLERDKQSGLVLANSVRKGGEETPRGVSMAPLSLASMSDLLKEMTKVLDKMEDFKMKGLKEIKSVQKEVESASSNAFKKFKEEFKLSTGNAAERNAVAYYRAVANFNVAYARWVQQPAMPLLNHSAAALRGVLHLVSKSLSAYGVAQKAE